MMQKLRDPKNVKMISLFVAAIFVLGCFALTLTQSGVNSVASAASSESAIGVVNYQMLLSQVPDLQNVQTSMKQEIDNAQKDFDEKRLVTDTWFENGVPICAEVCYNGQRILKILISSFTLN